MLLTCCQLTIEKNTNRMKSGLSTSCVVAGRAAAAIRARQENKMEMSCSAITAPKPYGLYVLSKTCPTAGTRSDEASGEAKPSKAIA